MNTVAHVFYNVARRTEVGEQRHGSGQALQFYDFRREPALYLRTGIIIAFLFLSNLCLQATDADVHFERGHAFLNKLAYGKAVTEFTGSDPP